MTLTAEKLRALRPGAEIVRQTGDGELAEAAGRLLDKIGAVLPSDLRAARPLGGLAVHAGVGAEPPGVLAALRRAVAGRRVVEIAYRGPEGGVTERRIRPLQTEYWGRVWTCPAWCELRGGFRVFRADRVERCSDTGEVFAPEPGRTYADYIAGLRLGGAG